MKFIQILIVLLVSLIATSSAALFVFTDNVSEFTIELTDPTLIQHARDLISGASTSSPHVMGTIVKSAASYNSPWSYYLDPSTISFFDFAIEVCDAAIAYTEDHLLEVGGAFLPGNVWCPWGSRLVREV
ncbi:hypothetical protein PPL_02656 [Heterostelium album PN500]|uniref:BP74 N-terminal domain-containing protein n=1 Tax=Heterostelium pallidum (strain ATCC 26659 / Pp 5 / PN500) TaxID=670386 RepID=D3B2P2_HETP5|nr:hypothetical protein PPL_02656 [Heterostelium album PN500]EFA83590.1 hypothetical protein PPL_02656 [Heterostelium album PN500]|eukprot:XP_020435707.1 hypothetical protein PPL_02656 [Heterostelium album PN500]